MITKRVCFGHLGFTSKAGGLQPTLPFILQIFFEFSYGFTNIWKLAANTFLDDCCHTLNLIPRD
jgi:hypothetical protein